MKELWLWLVGSSPVCSLCNAPYRMNGIRGGWGRFCEVCQTRLTRIVAPLCVVCGRVEESGGSRDICWDCMRIPPDKRVCNRSVVKYTHTARQVIHIFKYKGYEKLADPLGELLAEQYYREFRQKKISLVTFVPLSIRRMQERGFNQAERLARCVAKKIKLPIIDLLSRNPSHSYQSKRSRRERLYALKDTFFLKEDLPIEAISHSNILIVDDVYTTGATLRACAEPLLRGGAAQIFTLTFAR